MGEMLAGLCRALKAQVSLHPLPVWLPSPPGPGRLLQPPLYKNTVSSVPNTLKN